MNQLNQPWGLEKRNLNYSMPQQSCQTSLRAFGNDTKKSKKKSLKTLKPPQKFRCGTTDSPNAKMSSTDFTDDDDDGDWIEVSLKNIRDQKESQHHIVSLYFSNGF